jgi:phosphoenolpyruvate carboxykinase (GTP)
MLPFCGYNMADYLGHWLEMGEKSDTAKLPSIFYVNWFRKGSDGNFLWPGFGDNSRVLAWVCERVAGLAEAEKTPLGRVPPPGALDTRGLEVSEQALDTLLSVDPQEWRAEIPSIKEHYAMLGDRLPEELRHELGELERRLS